jgi:hypothetical protein
MVPSRGRLVKEKPEEGTSENKGNTIGTLDREKSE